MFIHSTTPFLNFSFSHIMIFGAQCVKPTFSMRSFSHKNGNATYDVKTMCTCNFRVCSNNICCTTLCIVPSKQRIFDLAFALIHKHSAERHKWKRRTKNFDVRKRYIWKKGTRAQTHTHHIPSDDWMFLRWKIERVSAWVCMYLPLEFHMRYAATAVTTTPASCITILGAKNSLR